MTALQAELLSLYPALHICRAFRKTAGLADGPRSLPALNISTFVTVMALIFRTFCCFTLLFSLRRFSFCCLLIISLFILCFLFSYIFILYYVFLSSVVLLSFFLLSSTLRVFVFVFFLPFHTLFIYFLSFLSVLPFFITAHFLPFCISLYFRLLFHLYL